MLQNVVNSIILGHACSRMHGIETNYNTDTNTNTNTNTHTHTHTTTNANACTVLKRRFSLGDNTLYGLLSRPIEN